MGCARAECEISILNKLIMRRRGEGRTGQPVFLAESLSLSRGGGGNRCSFSGCAFLFVWEIKRKAFFPSGDSARFLPPLSLFSKKNLFPRLP